MNKYIIEVKASVIMEADSEEEAREELEECQEEAKNNNFGALDDEMLLSASIVSIKRQLDDD